jgi:hypothetical protein
MAAIIYRLKSMRNYPHVIEEALSSVSRPGIPEGAWTRPGRLKAKGAVVNESMPGQG